LCYTNGDITLRLISGTALEAPLFHVALLITLASELHMKGLSPILPQEEHFLKSCHFKIVTLSLSQK
jgi:hypothetical protein